MAGDAEATRRRLLDAAADEFAEHGIAGARVDRIAAAAKSNKAQIYHYFTSKDGLWTAVIRRLHEAHEVPVYAADLPEYAGRLFDRFTADPKMARLAEWYCLAATDHTATDTDISGGTGPDTDSRDGSGGGPGGGGVQDKVAAIAQAQVVGRVPARFTPGEVLVLVTRVASMWRSVSPELAPLVRDIPHQRRRQVVVDAVAALLRD